MRPGQDRALKLRLASISGDAARVLSLWMHVECADVRVANAVAAALGDPAVSAVERRELSFFLSTRFSGGVDNEDEGRVVTLRFRVTVDESRAIRERAGEAGVTLSEYVRRSALG